MCADSAVEVPASSRINEAKPTPTRPCSTIGSEAPTVIGRFLYNTHDDDDDDVEKEEEASR